MLISPDILEKRWRKDQCLIEGVKLGSDESIFSRRACIAFYNDKFSKSDFDFINKYLDPFLKLIRDKPILVDEVLGGGLRITTMFRKLFTALSKTDESYEKVLHKFILLHNSILTESLDINANSDIVYEDENSSSTQFRRLLIPRIKSSKANCDFIIYDRSSFKLFIVEVKYSGVDDRAVGQILRYYHTIGDLLLTVQHGLDIRYLIPVLLVGEINKNTDLKKFPPYFRDILEILKYEIEPNFEGISIKNQRKVLRSTGI